MALVPAAGMPSFEGEMFRYSDVQRVFCIVEREQILFYIRSTDRFFNRRPLRTIVTECWIHVILSSDSLNRRNFSSGELQRLFRISPAEDLETNYYIFK